MRGAVWLFVCALFVSTGAEAGTRTVCASGCQYSNLQAAIDAAVPGDTILLRAGQTFTGNFVLRPKGGTSTAFITIKSDASASSLPADGVRLVPEGKPGANVARRALARLIGQGNTYKATPVVVIEPGAHHYRLQFLEIDGTANLGYETLVTIGNNNSSQTSLSQSPHSIVLDRVYIHGHPTKGSKRGIALNSRSTDVLNSYISDIKTFADSQAIGGFNGAGPFRIINNYLEAAGENIMFGGADPRIANLIPSDIEIRGNHFYKPRAWRNPILSTPSRPTVTSTSNAGSLPAGAHYFKVVAVLASGDANAYSAPSAEASAVVASGRGVTLSWPRVSGADRYRVYCGTASGAQNVYLETTATSFTYTGAGETAGAPKAAATRWTVKNLLEFKNAQRVTVDGNLFENNWAGFQDGYSIMFTPRNQEGTAPWVAVRDITFKNNVVRHVAAALKILGTDYNAPTQQARNIRIANNVFEDVNSTYGNTGRFLMITSGPANVTVDHNTIFNNGTVVEVDGPQVAGFVFTNNLTRHNVYGIKGQGTSTGIPTLTAYFPGYVFKGNVLAGGNSTLYPAGNYFPSLTEFNAMFLDLAGANYSLISSSIYNNKATDGTDIGVDTRALTAALSAAGPGDTPADPPPTANTPPIAEAGGPYSGTAGALMLFDGSRSTDAEAPLAGYRWHFGEDIVLRAADVPAANVHGRWKRVTVSGAAAGIALENADAGEAKKTTALASPVNYVDIAFNAAAGVPYFVWLRMRAANDSYLNDSLYLQFSGAVSATGAPVYRIGTTGGMAVVLEEGGGAGLAGWGWNDNGYGAIGSPVYFATAGMQTIRIQQREDGILFDQIVISAAAFAGRSPGEYKADATIIPVDLGTDTGITTQHAYVRPGTYPVSLIVTDAAGQSDEDGSIATVRPRP